MTKWTDFAHKISRPSPTNLRQEKFVNPFLRYTEPSVAWNSASISTEQTDPFVGIYRFTCVEGSEFTEETEVSYRRAAWSSPFIKKGWTCGKEYSWALVLLPFNATNSVEESRPSSLNQHIFPQKSFCLTFHLQRPARNQSWSTCRYSTNTRRCLETHCDATWNGSTRPKEGRLLTNYGIFKNTQSSKTVPVRAEPFPLLDHQRSKKEDLPSEPARCRLAESSLMHFSGGPSRQRCRACGSSFLALALASRTRAELWMMVVVIAAPQRCTNFRTDLQQRMFDGARSRNIKQSRIQQWAVVV